MSGMLAKKIGQTRVFNKENGQAVAITVLQAGPCVVMETKAYDSGKKAVQLAFGSIKNKHLTKPMQGFFKAKNQSPQRYLREFEVEDGQDYKVGQSIVISEWVKAGQKINARGFSKGKGFQGVIKRHHFAGGFATHGCSLAHRAGGSIGQRTWPGKVFKGKKMAGRMGGKKVSIKNLEVFDVDADAGLLLVKGSIPGAKNSLIELRKVS